jgi:hypothetical protein
MTSYIEEEGLFRVEDETVKEEVCGGGGEKF